jgi:hypothetical protein
MSLNATEAAPKAEPRPANAAAPAPAPADEWPNTVANPRRTRVR